MACIEKGWLPRVGKKHHNGEKEQFIKLIRKWRQTIHVNEKGWTARPEPIPGPIKNCATIGCIRPLQDELLEEIFLRLPTAADLARASTACVSFRRVVVGHPFLRRFRALHPPPLLGIICGGLTPAQPPHPSAAAAATLADVSLSCSFLPPSSNSWCRRDGRDGRVLFSAALKGTRDDCDRRELVREFAVCDPLHGRYLLLPAVPDHLAGQVHPPDIMEFEPLLAPPGDDEKSSFRDFGVMCLVWCKTKLLVFVFSSCAGQWLPDPVTFDVLRDLEAAPRHYAHGCFCWHLYVTDSLLVLDARRMEFSVIDLPPPPCPYLGDLAPYLREMTIVEAGEGRLGMLTLSEPSVCHLLYEEQYKDGNGTNQWQSKPVISLPAN
ncbi:uncharacterized protein LOC125518242 [Triticum urartu]|uniref:uncharacterized protein LOC125518242 n=1 Tax=Triticum urartu TaxID=4572 RepID=UPI0020444738|nr:uncharacterized protein LOC125518242 [Triticum urartu]